MKFFNKKNTKFILIALILVIIAFVLGIFLSPKKVEKAPEKPVKKVEETVNQKALKSYSEVLKSLPSYDFASSEYEKDTHQGPYEYALVHMNNEKIPQLLVAETLSSGNSGALANIRVFSYDEKAKKVIAPENVYVTGVATGGGFRGSIGVSKEKKGLIYTNFNAANGDCYTTRILLENNTIKEDQLPVYNISQDENPVKDEILDIKWVDIQDKEYLKKGVLEDKLENKPIEQVEKPADTTEDENREAESPRAKAKSTPSPENSEEVVLTGTVKVLTRDELLKLQNTKDPNPGTEEGTALYAVFELDQPTPLTLRSAGGGTFTKKATLIRLGDAFTPERIEEWKPYKDKRITVGFKGMGWPSDTSLPLGAPGYEKSRIIK